MSSDSFPLAANNNKIIQTNQAPKHLKHTCGSKGCQLLNPFRVREGGADVRTALRIIHYRYQLMEQTDNVSNKRAGPDAIQPGIVKTLRYKRWIKPGVKPLTSKQPLDVPMAGTNKRPVY